MVNSARASLLVRGGPNSGMSIPLTGSPLALGRRSDNDLVVNDTTVSRRHALIMETPRGFVVRDLISTNGTFVSEDKMGRAERPLNHGDRVRLAGSEVTFIFSQEDPSTVKTQTGPSG